MAEPRRKSSAKKSTARKPRAKAKPAAAGAKAKSAARAQAKAKPAARAKTKPAAAKAKTSASARKPAAKKAAARKPAATARKAAAKSSARKPAAKKAAARRRAASKSRSQGFDITAKSAAELREALSSRLLDPMGIVMISRERIEEAVEDAVSRGRVTSADAQDLITSLLDRGRKQTDDVLGDLEGLLGRIPEEIEKSGKRARARGEKAAKRARKQVDAATSRARKDVVKQVDPVLATADKARRAAGIPPSFPVLGYDDLTVAQIKARLADLKAPELRKVRDYEKRHGNRKGILAAVEAKL